MEISRQLIKDTLGWGFLLWFIGYILGIVLFMIVPPSLIGWVITPIASAFTLWVLIKKIKSTSLQYYLLVGIVWCILAVVFDYFLIVKAFNPADGYYKLDVYIYYVLTVALPLVVGLRGRKSTVHG